VEQEPKMIRIWAIRIAVIVVVLLSVLLVLYVVSLLFGKPVWAVLRKSWPSPSRSALPYRCSIGYRRSAS
jgi:hypothetical protein